MIDIEYIEIDGLLYPNIQFDDAKAYNNLGKYGKFTAEISTRESTAAVSRTAVHG